MCAACYRSRDIAIATVVVRLQDVAATSLSIATAEGFLNRTVAACILQEYRQALKREGLYLTRPARQSIKSFRLITQHLKRKHQGA